MRDHCIFPRFGNCPTLPGPDISLQQQASDAFVKIAPNIPQIDSLTHQNQSCLILIFGMIYVMNALVLHRTGVAQGET